MERSRARSVHGCSGTRLYGIWCGMRDRCSRPRNAIYGHYGGRGIRVCAEWLNDFATFREWALANSYRDDLSLDRVDSNGDYCPGNCRWATHQQQSDNTRRAFRIAYAGETRSLKEWSRILGFRYLMVYKRIRFWGWSPEEAFATPAGGKRRKGAAL